MKCKLMLLATIVLFSQFINAQQTSIFKKQFYKANTKQIRQSKQFYKAQMQSVPQLTLRWYWDEQELNWQAIPDSITSTYNAYGKIINELTSNTNIEEFPNKYLNLYSYDSKNREIAALSLTWNFQVNKWDTSFKTVSGYDSHGNQNLKEGYSYEDGEWFFNDAYKITYIYTGNKPTEVLFQYRDPETNNYINESKALLYYNNQNNLIEILDLEWDNDLSKYDTSYKQTNIVWYKWDSLIIENSLMLSSQTLNWNEGAGFVLDTRDQTAYDNHDNETEYKEEVLTDSGWVADYWQQYTLTYNNENVLTEKITKRWSDDAFANDIREVYSNFFVYNGIVAVSNNNIKTIVYPNPFKTSFTIEADLSLSNGNYTLNIFDIVGRNIFSQPINTPKTTIENTNVKSGLYTYTIVLNNNIVANGKLVVE